VTRHSLGGGELAVRKESNRTRAKRASTELALEETNTVPTAGLGKPGAALPEELIKADDGLARVHQAFATTDRDLISYLRMQAVLAAGGKLVQDNAANSYSFAAIQSLGARDGLEALLVVQMVGVHTMAMKFLANAAREDQTSHGRELNTNLANRLLRTFTAQVEALKKYRSKGEQHCTVEHVHVHSGGQAVVGTVMATGRERGEGEERNSDQ